MLLCKVPLAPESLHYLLPCLPQACHPSSCFHHAVLAPAGLPGAGPLLQACSSMLPFLPQGLLYNAGLASAGCCSSTLPRLAMLTWLLQGLSSLQV